ncbi:MAG: D-aminoacylase [Acidobacteria bacterium]|nr:D-aminoacylase [Acidobacteriota bacterium]
MLLAGASCSSPTEYDVIIRNGFIYDGTGHSAVKADLAIADDTIAAIGNLTDSRAETEIDATGLAVTPGFINMMSHTQETILADGRAKSDMYQGITLEVMGEGRSMGPLNDAVREDLRARGDDIPYDFAWTTLEEYLQHLETRGVSPNVASFVGATTVRIHELGQENRPPSPEELKRMRTLVQQAMEQGAMGVASALMQVPGPFADTNELIELAKVAADHDGLYASHIRFSGPRLLDGVGEVIAIAREAGIRAEVYHLKAVGRENAPKLGEAIAMIERARGEGLEITADVYPYNAGSGGLTAAMPPWVGEGGQEARVRRLKDPALRKRIAREMLTPADDWENLYLGVGGPSGYMVVGLKNPDLKHLNGKTIAEIAELWRTSPEEAAMDLIIKDDSRVMSVGFSMSEENVSKKIPIPWMSFCTDSPAVAPEGIFLKTHIHPRAYGSFPRILAKYVREENALSLEEAVRKMAALPAANLKLDRRGMLREGYYADVLVFDPKTIQDRATYTEPHQFSTGMLHVFVNGGHVVNDGEHTGATPGRFVRGPGWKGREGREP